MVQLWVYISTSRGPIIIKNISVARGSIDKPIRHDNTVARGSIDKPIRHDNNVARGSIYKPIRHDNIEFNIDKLTTKC